jgi:hypothetical protein
MNIAKKMKIVNLGGSNKRSKYKIITQTLI